MSSHVVKDAEALLARGKSQEARKLLLGAGYGRSLDTQAQQAFERLFPPDAELEKQLQSTLSSLRKGQLEARRKAATWLAREACKESRPAWLGDPRTTAILTEAFKDEDPKVVDEAITAFGATAGLWHEDFRAYPAVLELLKSKSKRTRMWAVHTAWLLAGADALVHLLSLFKDKAEDVRAAAIASPAAVVKGGGAIPAELRQRLRGPLEEALSDKSIDVRMGAISSLEALKDASVIGPLQKALEVETDPIVKEILELTLQRLQG